MTNPNKTDLVFIIDRSGSMATIAKAMSQGFNEFINKQRLEPGECDVTTYQFDDEVAPLYVGKPINEVPEYELIARGQTSLLDAIAQAIDAEGVRLAALPESERPSKVLFNIITDGEENSSKKYRLLEGGRERVFKKIKHQREKYNWEFIFLGANQDAIAQAKSLGISTTNAVTYRADRSGTTSLLGGLSKGVSNFRRSAGPKMDNIYCQKDYAEAEAVNVIVNLSQVKRNTPRSG